MPQTSLQTNVTEQAIREGLTELGIGRGQVVIVHSSIKSFGKVVGGADVVIDALCQAVGGEGAVVMPTFTYGDVHQLTDAEKARGFRWKIKHAPFDPSSTPCKTGLIPETFWRREGVARGDHRTHSFAAWGNEAKILSQGMSTMLAKDPLVLLLGVDINSCSAMHEAEERVTLPPSISSLMIVPSDVRATYPEDQWDIGFGPEPAWNLVYEDAVKQGLVRECRIGSGRCSAFRANAIVSLYESYLRDRPAELFHNGS